jgi:hypothetical protein
MPKKIYQLTVTLEFEHGIDRLDWLEELQKNPPSGSVLKNFRSKLLFEQCRLCGVKRNRGTLGSGVIGEPADECRSAHALSCQRRQVKNAESAS